MHFEMWSVYIELGLSELIPRNAVKFTIYIYTR